MEVNLFVSESNQTKSLNEVYMSEENVPHTPFRFAGDIRYYMSS